MKTQELLIGAHISAAGGVHNALIEGKRIGASTIQIFTANQRQWKSNPIEESEVKLWKEALEKTGLKKIASHSSYLINLGSPDPINLEKSIEAFKKEIMRCNQLGISFLVFHPGSALKDSVENCLDRIVDSLLQMEKLLENSPTRLLVETTAGQGTNVGYRFEELAYIIERTEKRLPIGVCLDTCHIFTAGHDIRTKEAWDKTLKEFDQIIGLEKLYAFHLNDSMKPLASRRDRHAPIGQGEIGIESFKILMSNKKTIHMPKYLETPQGNLWKEEIAMLRDFANSRP